MGLPNAEKKMKRLAILISMLLLASPIAVEDGKKSAPTGPSAEAQQAFTQQFWQAVDAGGKAFHKHKGSELSLV